MGFKAFLTLKAIEEGTPSEEDLFSNAPEEEISAVFKGEGLSLGQALRNVLKRAEGFIDGVDLSKAQLVTVNKGN